MAGIHGEVWLYQSGLTLVGAIDTAWRTGIAVFGLCDAAKWGQYRRVVSMPPSGANACRTPVWDEAAAGFDPRGLGLRGAAAPTPTTPRNMDTFCRPAAPAQQWQHDKSETRSYPR